MNDYIYLGIIIGIIIYSAIRIEQLTRAYTKLMKENKKW